MVLEHTVANTEVMLAGGATGIISTFIRGNKLFELSNHLGNVLTTISDKRLVVDANNDGTIDYYYAEVVTAQDYYPGGMLMPGRKYSSGNYRYGFGGQEKSNEIKGEGNSYTAEYWEYDPRIVRRWNLDPIASPNESRYAVFRGNPISYNDPNGDCPDCKDGKYKVQKGDNFFTLEKKWGMKQGSLAGYNQGLDPKKLKIGSSINVSPASVSVSDNPVPGGQASVSILPGTSTPAQPINDDSYLYDPSEKPTAGDRLQWAKWGVAGRFGNLASIGIGEEALASYRHYRSNTGTDYKIDLSRYFMTDYSGTTMSFNIYQLLTNNATSLLPYPGVRDFHTTVTTAGIESKLFPYPASENYQKAIGGFRFNIIGTITATQINNNLVYKISYTIHLADRYNFDRGKSDIASGTPDAVNGRFAVLGWAKAFNTYSTYTSEISATVPIKK
jgi:hypothetical protein